MNASAFNNDTLDGVRNSWDTVRGQIQVKFPGLTTQDLPHAPADLDALIDTIAQRTGQDHEQVHHYAPGLVPTGQQPASSEPIARKCIADGASGNVGGMTMENDPNVTAAMQEHWDDVRDELHTHFPGLTDQQLLRMPNDPEALVLMLVDVTGQEERQVRQQIEQIGRQYIQQR